MPKLTVFTPVYNRAHTIGRLYESLCRQDCKDFEWIIVNDGSTDNIDSVVENFKGEGKITIRYFSKPNGGKHTAINKGVKEAAGDWFFIVDSDDYVADFAVKWILDKGAEIIDDESFAGLSGLRVNPDGTRIGGENNFGQIDTDAESIREEYNIKGDLAEIYKTEVLRKFPFPEIPGERFCSEGLVWNRISMAGLKLRYCYERIYICEYLAGGLTATRVDCRRNSPEYSMLLYSELISNPVVKLKNKVKYGLLFWRYSERSNRSWHEKARMVKPAYRLLWPLGVALRNLKR